MGAQTDKASGQDPGDDQIRQKGERSGGGRDEACDRKLTEIVEETAEGAGQVERLLLQEAVDEKLRQQADKAPREGISETEHLAEEERCKQTPHEEDEGGGLRSVAAQGDERDDISEAELHAGDRKERRQQALEAVDAKRKRGQKRHLRQQFCIGKRKIRFLRIHLEEEDSFPVSLPGDGIGGVRSFSGPGDDQVVRQADDGQVRVTFQRRMHADPVRTVGLADIEIAGHYLQYVARTVTTLHGDLKAFRDRGQIDLLQELTALIDAGDLRGSGGRLLCGKRQSKRRSAKEQKEHGPGRGCGRLRFFYVIGRRMRVFFHKVIICDLSVF